MVTPDATDVVAGVAGPGGVALNRARKAKKGDDAAKDIRRASDAKRSVFDIETGQVNLKNSDFGLKIDGPIPNSVPGNLSRGQLDDAIDAFETSLSSRKAELSSFDASGVINPGRVGHARRISEEEAFLSQLKKARDN